MLARKLLHNLSVLECRKAYATFSCVRIFSRVCCDFRKPFEDIFNDGQRLSKLSEPVKLRNVSGSNKMLVQDHCVGSPPSIPTLVVLEREGRHRCCV